MKNILLAILILSGSNGFTQTVFELNSKQKPFEIAIKSTELEVRAARSKQFIKASYSNVYVEKQDKKCTTLKFEHQNGDMISLDIGVNNLVIFGKDTQQLDYSYQLNNIENSSRLKKDDTLVLTSKSLQNSMINVVYDSSNKSLKHISVFIGNWNNFETYYLNISKDRNDVSRLIDLEIKPLLIENYPIEIRLKYNRFNIDAVYMLSYVHPVYYEGVAFIFRKKGKPWFANFWWHSDGGTPVIEPLIDYNFFGKGNKRKIIVSKEQFQL